MYSFIALLISGLLAAGCLFGAFFNFRRKRLIDDLPTSLTRGVFIGLTEVKGTAESDMPLTSYLAGARCVYYSWRVEEHWSRTVTETYTDSKGHAQTRTRTESGWKKVASEKESIPFYIKDEAGILRIIPDKAEIHPGDTFNETVGRDSPLYFDKGPQQEISNSTHRRRFQEHALVLHAPLYVVGQARERKDIAAAEIAYDNACPLFLISTRTEKQISTRYSRWFWFWFITGFALLLAGIGVSALLTEIEFSPPSFILAAMVYLLVFWIIWLWLAYNSLIDLHNRVKQGWSQVDVMLKRRHHLIPNLVRIVEGYGNHERETHELLAELRGQMQATPPGISGPDFKGLASSLRMTFERYPELKASEQFMALQNSLTDTEQRIALARDYYNNIATFYNTRLEIIPDRYAAAIARLKSRKLMGAADFERLPVKVDLAP